MQATDRREHATMDDKNATSCEIQQLVSESAVAKQLSISRSLLRKWRRTGYGPNWVKLGGKCVRYEASHISEWLKRQTRNLG